MQINRLRLFKWIASHDEQKGLRRMISNWERYAFQCQMQHLFIHGLF